MKTKKNHTHLIWPIVVRNNIFYRLIIIFFSLIDFFLLSLKIVALSFNFDLILCDHTEYLAKFDFEHHHRHNQQQQNKTNSSFDSLVCQHKMISSLEFAELCLRCERHSSDHTYRIDLCYTDVDLWFPYFGVWFQQAFRYILAIFGIFIIQKSYVNHKDESETETNAGCRLTDRLFNRLPSCQHNPMPKKIIWQFSNKKMIFIFCLIQIKRKCTYTAYLEHRFF